MDPGRVVWLPGTGITEGEGDQACELQYGGSYYACGSEEFANGWTMVYCCA
jgi:hypothetical protein